MTGAAAAAARMAEFSGSEAMPARAGRFARAPRWLPAGAGLPDHLWGARHAWIFGLLCAHAVAIPVFALVRGYGVVHTALESVAVPVLAAVASWPQLNRRLRTTITSVGLLTCSAILVHLSGGVIEMHFHFFVMVAVVALYQDWLPFLAAIAYVLVHHGVVGVIDPDAVYNHPAAINGPWKWAGIHAFFIAGASVAALARWRLSETAMADRLLAEEKLVEESRIVESLYEVAKLLAADLDGDRVVQAVTDAATELTGAAYGAFFYNVLDDQGESYMLYTLSGAPLEAFSAFGMPRNTPVFAATFSGSGPVRLDDVTQDPRYGQVEPHRGMPKGHLPVRSYLAVPVKDREGKVLGGLFFGHPEPGRFDEVAERIVVGIASHASVALHNARLYESEHAARASAEVAAHRLSVLADASRALFSSLEPEAVFESVSRIVTMELADFCFVDFLEEDGSLRRVVAGKVDESAGALPVVDPPSLDDRDHPVVTTMRTRKAQFVAAGPGDRPPAAIVVPLTGRHDVLGTLSLGVLQESTARLTEHDIPFAEEIARRASLALENARLYERQRSLAETLQHSLLPERLPTLPGLECAAMYVAGGPGVEVGGDWYDVIPLPGGRLGIAIGDVVGRGEKAASLMGQLRNALRAYAVDGKSPAEVVSGLNLLITYAGPEQMATLIYGVLDPSTSEICLSNAGHPPVLRIDASGETSYVDAVGGLPLGAVVGNRYSEATVSLEGGDAIVLYTDGLVEDRASSIDEGLARLQQAVTATPGDLHDLCAELAARMLAGAPCNDDMAILAVRLQPLGDRLTMRLPTDASVLGPLRSTLRRWLASAGATEQETFELLVACGEAATNAIRHAGGLRGGEFEVNAILDGDVHLTVRDRGRWREPRVTVGGRGLSIIESYVDALDIDRGERGTVVSMRRRLACQDLARPHQ